MKSYMPKPGEIERVWHVVDLDGVVLGRAASKIATILRGKHKPQFSPHIDVGDFVICINASKVRLTGKKETDKIYYRVGRKLGHVKETPAGELREQNPDRLLRLAVKGMLPRNIMGRNQIKKLKVYAGAEHPHEAQQPKPLRVEG